MMDWRQRLRGLWPGKRARPATPATAGDAPARGGDTHLLRAADSLRALLDDSSIPPELRQQLADDYAEVEAMLDKLEQGRIHIAVFGRVSVGKSALLNALLGRDAFQVGVLHGTTRERAAHQWQEAGDDHVQLIDTPGIDELDGEQREELAQRIASRSDLVLFVIDGDLTATELDALQRLLALQRPLLVVLNKIDRYHSRQRAELRASLSAKLDGLVPHDRVIEVCALPAPQRVLQVQADGSEVEIERTRPADVSLLRERVLSILESEGKTLAALNAAVFAGELSDQVGSRLAELRRDLAHRITRSYCLAKGVAVGLNPIPAADLLAAAGLDIALVMHLSRIYGLPLTRSEAGQLLATILGQLVALMGAIWGVHLVASALKLGSAGLSTALTAGAQGALAWYATLLVARAAERYLAAGKSWGEQGPKRVVRDIVNSLDRDSVLREARAEILARLKLRKDRPA
jgi:GTPase